MGNENRKETPEEYRLRKQNQTKTRMNKKADYVKRKDQTLRNNLDFQKRTAEKLVRLEGAERKLREAFNRKQTSIVKLNQAITRKYQYSNRQAENGKRLHAKARNQWTSTTAAKDCFRKSDEAKHQIRDMETKLRNMHTSTRDISAKIKSVQTNKEQTRSKLTEAKQVEKETTDSISQATYELKQLAASR